MRKVSILLVIALCVLAVIGAPGNEPKGNAYGRPDHAGTPGKPEEKPASFENPAGKTVNRGG